MKAILFYDIQWDTSSDEPEPAPAPDLPERVVLMVDDDLDVEEYGADALSDTYGFCVDGFYFEALPQAVELTYEEIGAMAKALWFANSESQGLDDDETELLSRKLRRMAGDPAKRSVVCM